MAVLDVNPDRRRRKKTVNFAWEKYHAVREQSRSTGATGSAAELAGFMPP